MAEELIGKGNSYSRIVLGAWFGSREGKEISRDGNREVFEVEDPLGVKSLREG